MEHEQSPYAPPKSNVETEMVAQEIIPAERWRRFVNFLVDYAGFTLLGAVVGVVSVILFGDKATEFFESTPDIVVGTPIFVGYYILLEGLTGRTIGKLITGTKVVNEEGLKPSFGQIVGRAFSRMIPFEAFSFFGEQVRGWHDSLPKTYVVKCR